ncbi:hypothetical protein [Marinobacter sp.]|uniref:hypothetical protein n=1 Tax=Marinobacter sp. TaxID=50741 RepID=UPI003A90C18D
MSEQHDFRIEYREADLFHRVEYIKGESKEGVRQELMQTRPYIFPVHITRVKTWAELGEVA